MPIVQQTLNAIDPISLADMDSHALMNRVDTKYVLSTAHLQELLESVGHAYRVLSINSIRLSTYSTLYFDTPDHECYRQHHNGKLNRRKFRMRQYQSSGACFLEVKAKDNKGRTKKQRIAIDDLEESLSPSSRSFIESVIGYLPDLTPQLWSFFFESHWSIAISLNELPLISTLSSAMATRGEACQTSSLQKSSRSQTIVAHRCESTCADTMSVRCE